jgi:environmental stress-induced protein Ves
MNGLLIHSCAHLGSSAQESSVVPIWKRSNADALQSMLIPPSYDTQESVITESKPSASNTDFPTSTSESLPDDINHNTNSRRGSQTTTKTSPPVYVPPKVAILQPSNFKQMTWKNGLGTTSEIAIYPPASDFRKEKFVWRLSVSDVKDSCSFSVFPGFDIAVTLLPPNPSNDSESDPATKSPMSKSAKTAKRGKGAASGTGNAVELYHNDQEAPAVSLKTLVPYTYAGEIPTSCILERDPVKQLTLIANRTTAQVCIQLAL